MLDLVVKPVVELQREHHKTLFGDGSESNQGLRVDMDRVKQDRRRSDRHFWVVYPTLLALLLKTVWDFIIGHAARGNP